MPQKIVYVTGCLGFIGLHVTRHCLAQGWRVIGVDASTYASNQWVLPEFRANPNFLWVPSDINDLDRLYDCDWIINTAAETHVDNSIVNSDRFLRSNVNGVHHLLKLIMEKRWFRMPTLLHFSTDEVYGDIVSGSHTETDLLRPSNPYSATKAAADQLILAWNRTYGVPYVIMRPTNNYGVGQYTEKLIPKSVKHLVMDRLIDIHDNGDPVRTWLHVTDTAQAVITVIEAGVANEIYNVSGNVELPNRVVVQKILSLFFGKEIQDSWQDHTQPVQRAGQDVRYSINDTKLKHLGWQPHAVFDNELANVVAWYKEHWTW